MHSPPPYTWDRIHWAWTHTALPTKSTFKKTLVCFNGYLAAEQNKLKRLGFLSILQHAFHSKWFVKLWAGYLEFVERSEHRILPEERSPPHPTPGLHLGFSFYFPMLLTLSKRSYNAELFLKRESKRNVSIIFMTWESLGMLFNHCILAACGGTDQVDC